MLVISAYLQCSIGLKDNNLTIMEDISDATKRWNGPMVTGADFNEVPSIFIAAGYQNSMGVKVVAPNTNLGTCRTARGSRIIDFFLVQ